jgi:hypothetical protein
MSDLDVRLGRYVVHLASVDTLLSNCGLLRLIEQRKADSKTEKAAMCLKSDRLGYDTTRPNDAHCNTLLSVIEKSTS